MNDPTQDPSTTPDPQTTPDASNFAPPPDLGSVDLRGGGKSKVPMILVGLAVAGGIAGIAYKMVATRNAKKIHAAVMQRFKDVESDDVGPFWICLLGPNVDPGLFPDNNALGQRIEASFAGDPLHFPDKVIDDCVPKLKGAGDKGAGLEAPDDYREALSKYGKAVDGLGGAIGEWASHAKQRGVEKEAENKINAAANAFHAAEAKPTPEAIAYERVLRCTFADIDKVVDEQALLQRLFEECKKPEFVERVRSECSKAATPAPAIPGVAVKEDKAFKEAFKKFGADDRDLSAWADCFKKGRKGEKRDTMLPFGRAWATYMEASREVRKIGAAALKDD
jgi:hypothetical protein